MLGLWYLCKKESLLLTFVPSMDYHITAVSSEAWAKLRDWASVAGRGRLLLSGSVAHASLKTTVHYLIVPGAITSRSIMMTSARISCVSRDATVVVISTELRVISCLWVWFCHDGGREKKLKKYILGRALQGFFYSSLLLSWCRLGVWQKWDVLIL